MTNKFKTIPSFYHPITIAMLDDNRAFLSSLELLLSKNSSCLISTDPSVLRKKISCNNAYDISSVLETLYDEESEPLGIRVDFNSIKELMLNDKRCNYIGALLVDYHMPIENGLDFSTSIKATKPDLFTVLLTAGADEKIAIDAFNKNLIDHFLMKTDAHLEMNLNETVFQAKEKLFNQFSTEITSALDISVKRFLASEDYLKVFNEIFVEKSIIEFYLLDRNGNFLLVSDEGKFYFLVVQSASQRDADLDTLKSLEANERLFSRLQNDGLLYLPSEKTRELAITEWERFIHPSTQLNANYSYALIETSAEEVFPGK